MTQPLTQKWAIVAFLEPTHEGMEFFWKDWPLHVTILATFAVNHDSIKFFDAVTRLIEAYNAFTVTSIKQLQWGTHQVMQLADSTEIVNLHLDIVKLLHAFGGTLNEPNYAGEQYIPHSTVQSHAGLTLGSNTSINFVSIIDMFPHCDGQQRRIYKTVALKI